MKKTYYILIIIAILFLGFLVFQNQGYSFLKENIERTQAAVNEYLEAGCMIPSDSTLENPAPVNFQLLSGYFEKDLEFKKPAKYWLTKTNEVFASTIDAPDVEQGDSLLTWNKVTDAEKYNIYYVNFINTPIVLHHGTNDKSVPLKWSLNLVNKLQEYNKNYKFYRYTDDHNLSNNFFSVLRKDVIFFKSFIN